MPAWTDKDAGVGVTVKSGAVDGETITVLEAEPVWAAESVTVSVAVKLPAVEY